MKKNKINYVMILCILVLSFNYSKSADSLWTSVASLNVKILYDISFINKNIGYICGDSGKIYKTIDAGKTWILKESGTREHLYSIKFSDTLNGYNDVVGLAVGDKGAVTKSTDLGETWVPQNTFISKNFVKINIFNSSFSWILSEYGTVYRSSNRGNTWDSINNLKNYYFYDACFVLNNGWVVGGNNITCTIYHTSNAGLKWEIQDSTSFPSALSIHFLDLNYGWACGLNGSIIHTSNGGKNWIKQESGITDHIFKIFFVDKLNGWATSKYGIIINTSDGGNTWSKQISGMKQQFYGLYFYDKDNGFAVGTNGTVLKYKNIKSDVEENATTINNINFYPNPSKETLNLKLYSEPEPNEELIITDIFGNNVLKIPIENTQNQIDIAYLVSGIYLCKLRHNGVVFKIEVIK